jgi:hypothetical protein
MKWRVLLVACAVSAVCSAPALATPLSGTFQMSGIVVRRQRKWE